MVRERKAAANILAGMPVSHALEKAGYAHSTSTHKSAEVLSRIRENLAEQLEQLCPLEPLIENLYDLATGQKKKMTRLLNPKTGEVHEYADEDTWSQVKATELLGKLMGGLVTRREDTVKHEVDFADIVAKRRARMGELQKAGEPVAMLPEPQADVQAEVITAEPQEAESFKRY